MSVKFILVENYREKTITTGYFAENSGFIPVKGDEVVLSDRDNEYHEKKYKVIKRVIDFVYSSEKSETNHEPYEIKIYLKEIKI